MNISEKIVIKNGGLKTTDFIYLGTSIAAVLLSLYEPDKSIRFLGIGIFGTLFIYFSYLLFNRIKDKEIKIDISEHGFKFLDDNSSIPWAKISEVEIKRGKADMFDILVYYLIITIETKDSIQTKIKSLEELKFNKNEVLEFSMICIKKYFDKEKNTYCG